MGMKQCPNCQRMYSDHVSVCAKCGTSLSGGAAPIQRPVIQPQWNQQPQQPQQPQWNQQQQQQQWNQQQWNQPQQQPQQPQWNQPQENPAPSQKISVAEAYKRFFANYSNFSGRARQSEYFIPVILNSVISYILAAMAAAGGVFALLYMVFSLAILVPGLAVCVRRLHDVGKSGKYYFWCFTIIGIIPVFIQLCKDSQPGPNQYGPSTKY